MTVVIDSGETHSNKSRQRGLGFLRSTIILVLAKTNSSTVALFYLDKRVRIAPITTSLCHMTAQGGQHDGSAHDIRDIRVCIRARHCRASRSAGPSSNSALQQRHMVRSGFWLLQAGTGLRAERRLHEAGLSRLRPKARPMSAALSLRAGQGLRPGLASACTRS